MRLGCGTVESVVTVDTADGRVIGLDVSHQSITTVTKEIGSLSRLVTLDLRGNRIQSLPGQIGYLSALRECRLDSNSLYELPSEFAYCCSLKILTAGNNNLYRLDTRLAKLPIVHLDLRSNILNKLPDANPIFPGIRFLYLDDNSLTSLPDALQQLQPEEFSIANNRLCTVSEKLSRWLASYDEDWAASQGCSETSSPQ
jgi:leucine-rich repeat protein SHOC2